ncbi:hypothetical protein B0H11DRAFT_1061153 [Mycena galericulata]|nr:hypothetical protein B0H11DRAFT_1061153 [Mycena galericulata]
MPEIFEAGYFFSCYIWIFIALVTIAHGPSGLNIIGLWCDLSKGESDASADRETALLSYAASLDKQALQRGHLARWANDLEDLADAIPDTHGLMIHVIWKGLPPPIRRQVSPNHSSWPSFCAALRNLSPDYPTIPDILPIPWHRRPLASHIPYEIGKTPSRSALAVKLNGHMPELFRGRDPDPTRRRKSKARSVSPPNSVVSDVDDEDLDTGMILEPEPDNTPVEASHLPGKSANNLEHGEGTDFSGYFWPRYSLPILSAGNVIASAGLRLVGLVYDARKTIMNLGTAFLEFEPLLHTSPQIYTSKQWRGVIQVPRTHRGFKIGYALEFATHTLSWNSFDNNFRLHWRTRAEFSESFKKSYVPDPIHEYPHWCTYTVVWLRQVSCKSLKNLTILQALSAPGRQPFRGLGRYGTNEVLSIAGIPAWILFNVVLNDPVLFGIICEAFFEFVSTRGVKAEEYYRKAASASPSATTQDDNNFDHSINTTLKQQLEYIETLRTHGRSRTFVSDNEAELIDKYNEASLNTWDEHSLAQKRTPSQNLFASKTDMTRVFFPFDFANVRSSVMKFGHLGPLIAGKYWEAIKGELLESPELLKKLEKEHQSLSRMLRPSELLLLKPEHLLSSPEYAELQRLVGWSENPIIKHFGHINHAKSCTRIDQRRLSLVSSKNFWRDTYLVKMETRTGFIWTTLCPPFISRSTRSRISKNGEQLEHKPLYTIQSETLHDESTIEYIKNKTKGWTVGPYDFVGHGRIIHHGSSSFVGLCFWHPDLAPSQMLKMQASWDARSRYPQGMRKLAKDQVVAEKNWRSKIRMAICKDMGAVAATTATSDYFSAQIIKHRKSERNDLLHKIRGLRLVFITPTSSRNKKLTNKIN